MVEGRSAAGGKVLSPEFNGTISMASKVPAPEKASGTYLTCVFLEEFRGTVTFANNECGVDFPRQNVSSFEVSWAHEI